VKGCARSRQTHKLHDGPQFPSYVSDEQRKKFVEFILDQYMGDMRLALWLGDQVFGEAP
jgi:hypothetical protein